MSIHSLAFTLVLSLSPQAMGFDGLEDTGVFPEPPEAPATFDMFSTLTQAATQELVSDDGPPASAPSLLAMAFAQTQSEIHGYTLKRRAQVDWDQLRAWSGPHTAPPPTHVRVQIGNTVVEFEQRYHHRPLGHVVWSGQADDGSTLTIATNVHGDLRARSLGPRGEWWLVDEGQQNYWWHRGERTSADCAHNHIDNDNDSVTTGTTARSNPAATLRTALSPRREGAQRKSVSRPTPLQRADTTVDVIQMFSNGAANDYSPFAAGSVRRNATLEAFLNVAYTNHTLANSNLSTRIRLLHVDVVPAAMFRDRKSLMEVRNDLREGLTPLGQRAHTLRDAFGADLVTMHKRPAGATAWAGIAFVLGVPGVAQNQRGRPRNAYTVLNVTPDTNNSPVIGNVMSSYAHELFHLFGATHSRFNAGYIERWRDSNGFYNGGYLDEHDYSWHTIMTYHQVCERLCNLNLGPLPVPTADTGPPPPPFDREGECNDRCQELPMLSSPSFDVPRGSISDPFERSGTEESNNARVLRTTSDFVREYREPLDESLDGTFVVSGTWASASEIDLSWDDTTLPLASGSPAAMRADVNAWLDYSNLQSSVQYRVYVGRSLGSDDLTIRPITTRATIGGMQTLRLDSTQMTIPDGPMFFRVWAGLTFTNDVDDGVFDTGDPDQLDVDVWVYSDFRYVAGHWVGCSEDPSLAFGGVTADWNAQTCTHASGERLCDVGTGGLTLSCDVDHGPPSAGQHTIRSIRTPDPALNYDWLVYGEAGDGERFCCQYADPNDTARTFLLWGSTGADQCLFAPEDTMVDWADVMRIYTPDALAIQVATRGGHDVVRAHREDAATSWLIDGGDGDDVLHGSLFDDLMFGGLGGDRLFGHEGHDTLIDGGGEGDLLVGGSIPPAPSDGDNQLCGFGDGTTYIGGQGNNHVFHDRQAEGPPNRTGSVAGGPGSQCGAGSWDTGVDSADTASYRGGWAGLCNYNLVDSTPAGVSCASPNLKSFP